MKKNIKRVIAQNKKAEFNYEILEKYIAGIVLEGHEVKSIKIFGINLNGVFAIVKRSEIFLIGLNIPPYQPGNLTLRYNPKRDRKLLLKKTEIKNIINKLNQKRLTLIPLRVYNIKGLIKIELGIAKHKKKFEKKEKIKEREIDREIKKEIKNYNL
ncbi:MAG: SsrA-binding protein SmpB [Minisyncoccia bacterium]